MGVVKCYKPSKYGWFMVLFYIVTQQDPEVCPDSQRASGQAKMTMTMAMAMMMMMMMMMAMVMIIMFIIIIIILISS